MNNPDIKYYKNGNKWNEGWYKDGEYHREDGPAYQEWFENGNIEIEVWYKNGKYHRKDGPAYQTWHENGNKWSEVWKKDGNYHREDGPAIQWWDKNDNIIKQEYYLWGHMINGNNYEWPLCKDDLIKLRLSI